MADEQEDATDDPEVEVPHVPEGIGAEPSEEVDEALARLAKMKEDEPESSAPTPYWLGAVALIAVAGFLWLFPMLLDGGAAEQQRLEEALGYCKYREDGPRCEERVRARYEICVEKHDRANKPDHVDVYGQCMMEVFPDFYLTAGWNKR